MPIFGAKRPERVDENLGALDLRLSAGKLELLERVFRPGVAAGERYPPGRLARIGL